MTEFTEKMVLLVIDKGVLGLLLLAFGLIINLRLEKFRADRQRVSELEKELDKSRLSAQIAFREKQLSQFYWPIKMRLEKDSAMWRNIPHLTGGTGKLPIELGKRIERDFLIKNHMEIVDIVEKNIHLAEANSALLSDLVAYIKHVAVLRALRESDDYSFNPISLDAPFPSDFKEKIDKRSEALQKEYNKFALLNKGAKRAVKKSPKPNHTS